MWVIPAILAFLAGQFYLFHCLGKLDKYMEEHPLEEPPEKEVLHIAFAGSIPSNEAVNLVEDFVKWYPQVEIVLQTDPDPVDAVCRGKASVGIIPERAAVSGLRSLPLDGKLSHWQGVWKEGTADAATGDFLHFLREHTGTGNKRTFVI